MTFENGGSLRNSPSASRRTPNKINKRAKLTNSLLAQASEDKNEMSLSQSQSLVNKKFASRRLSSPHAKRLISPVYREKSSSRPKITYKDISLAYPTPELNYDFSQYDSPDSSPQDTGASNSGVDGQNGAADTNGASLSHSNGEQNGKNGDASGHQQWRSALMSLRSNRRMSLPVTSLEKQLENALTFATQIPKEKNEAEIIDGPRRGSLEDSAGLSVPGAAALKLQSRNSGVGVGRSASLKVGRGESLNRELRSHYMNGMQERKLRSACEQLDKQSYAGILEHKSRQQQLSKQHAELLKRSPSTDDWMSRRKCRTASLQERERESIDRRFSRRVRHFRAPKPLQDEVSAIRSVAMFHAGMYDVSRPRPKSPTEAKTLLRRIATIAGGGGYTGVHTNAAHLSNDRSRRNSKTGDDDTIIDLVSDENYDFHNSFASKSRSSLSGGETSVALRHLHSKSIPPRVAESGLAGLLNHSRRMSLVGVPSMEDMLQGLPQYLTGNDDTDRAATASARDRRSSTARGLSSMTGEPTPREKYEYTKEDDVFEDVDDFETKEVDHLSHSDSDDDPFSDLDQMSSDTDEEEEGGGRERDEDDNTFEEDRRNI